MNITDSVSCSGGVATSKKNTNNMNGHYYREMLLSPTAHLRFSMLGFYLSLTKQIAKFKVAVYNIASKTFLFKSAQIYSIVGLNIWTEQL